MNKAFLNGKIYDVYTPQEFCNTVYYDLDSSAIIYGNFILPIKFSAVCGSDVGIYLTEEGFWNIVIPTSEKDIENYSVTHLASYCSAETFKDIIAEHEKINSDQIAYLVSPDNITRCQIDDVNDTPLMIGLKTAINEKEIDINKYSSRFGQDFNNDRRKLNGHDITINKAVAIAKNTDMQVTVTFSDYDKNVPNPIGRKITVQLIP